MISEDPDVAPDDHFDDTEDEYQDVSSFRGSATHRICGGPFGPGSPIRPGGDDELDMAVMYYTPPSLRRMELEQHVAEAERLLQTKATISDLDDDPFSTWDEDFRFGYVWLKLADKRPNGARFVGVENDIVIRVEPPWDGYPENEY